jgi:hypothetical protein
MAGGSVEFRLICPNGLFSSIGKLPEELLHLIFEYAASSEKDMIRFGCVCQKWRMAILTAPSWLHLSHSHREHHHHHQPIDVFLAIHQQISSWIASQRAIQRRQVMDQIPFVLLAVADGLITFSGVLFGINWRFSQGTFLMIAFLASYLALLLGGLVVYFHQDKFKRERILVIIIVSLLLIALVSSQCKLLIPSSFLLWIEVISPLYLIFLCYCSLLYFFCHFVPSLPILCTIISTVMIPIPPLVTLILFCYSLDYSHSKIFSSFHPHQLIYLLSLHLSGLVWFFLFALAENLSRLVKRCRCHWDPENIKEIVELSLSLMINGIGLISTVLFFVQSIPSLSIAVLSKNFNLIFYFSLLSPCSLSRLIRGIGRWLTWIFDQIEFDEG